MRAMASAVTTPQPPAVVTTHTRGPFGSGWVAKVAAASYASSIVAARTTPAWRQPPSKTRSSVARLPVWLAAARAPTSEAPALDEHDRHALGHGPHALEEAAAVGEALDVGEPDRGRRIVGVVLEVVGDADRGGVARRDGPADPDAVELARSS